MSKRKPKRKIFPTFTMPRLVLIFLASLPQSADQIYQPIYYSGQRRTWSDGYPLHKQQEHREAELLFPTKKRHLPTYVLPALESLDLQFLGTSCDIGKACNCAQLEGFMFQGIHFDEKIAVLKKGCVEAAAQIENNPQFADIFCWEATDLFKTLRWHIGFIICRDIGLNSSFKYAGSQTPKWVIFLFIQPVSNLCQAWTVGWTC